MKAGIPQAGRRLEQGGEGLRADAKEYPSSAEANSARKYLGMAEAMAS